MTRGINELYILETVILFVANVILFDVAALKRKKVLLSIKKCHVLRIMERRSLIPKTRGNNWGFNSQINDCMSSSLNNGEVTQT